MMVIEYYLWLAIFLIPLVIGFIFLFFPHKVIQIRASIQYNMFKSLGMDDDKIDKSPLYSIFYGESYSNVLKSQLDNPREFRYLMIWVRILGFVFLCFGVISLGIIITLWRSS